MGSEWAGTAARARRAVQRAHGIPHRAGQGYIAVLRSLYLTKSKMKEPG